MQNPLFGTFDRVVVVNLARRPERLERFWRLLGDWPFRKPERFEAYDGQAIGIPAGWHKGAGAWGCLLSHLAIVEAAIKEGVSSLLVLEDDAYPVADFPRLAGLFLGMAPSDWDCLMLGAEHLLPPTAVAPGVVRCNASNRTHAYAIRGKMMGVLCDFWRKTTDDHCDLILSSLMRHFKAYAPNPLLIGQDSGHSDVTDRGERLRFLSGLQKETIGEADPRHRIEKLVTRVNCANRAVSPTTDAASEARAMFR